MSQCPYCGTSYHSTYPPLNLSKRQRAIYEVVASGGPRGADRKQLIHRVYGEGAPNSAWGVLRVNVHEINRKIKDRGQRIVGRRDIGYVLTSNSNTLIGDDDEPT